MALHINKKYIVNHPKVLYVIINDYFNDTSMCNLTYIPPPQYYYGSIYYKDSKDTHKGVWGEDGLVCNQSDAFDIIGRYYDEDWIDEARR